MSPSATLKQSVQPHEPALDCEFENVGFQHFDTYA